MPTVASAETVKSFYEAFKAKDGSQMAALYADDVEFEDPVFKCLRGNEAKSMWLMLCLRAKDILVDYKIITSDGNNLTVKWEARYTFDATQRLVHNKVTAELTIKDGKIIKHKDHFSFWRWSSQALGPVGILLGWSSFLQKKIQKKALTSLRTFTGHNQV
jgi:ketosteroid isomerase-like protein